MNTNEFKGASGLLSPYLPGFYLPVLTETIKDHQVEHFNINTLIIIYKTTIHNSLHFNWVLSDKCFFFKNQGSWAFQALKDAQRYLQFALRGTEALMCDLIKAIEKAAASQLQDQTHLSNQLKYQSNFTLNVVFGCGICNLQQQDENKT